ncbi:hypothetical protein ACQ4LE_005510, partial [Meloidogyne hapla]
MNNNFPKILRKSNFLQILSKNLKLSLRTEGENFFTFPSQNCSDSRNLSSHPSFFIFHPFNNIYTSTSASISSSNSFNLICSSSSSTISQIFFSFSTCSSFEALMVMSSLSQTFSIGKTSELIAKFMSTSFLPISSSLSSKSAQESP